MTKHKVFISYYHKDDEEYKNKFEDLFGDIFINKSVEEGEINSELNDEYIKRLIREKNISDSSVVVVLVGPHTYCRKHVDWEISAGLLKNTGLVGLALPSHSSYKKDTFNKNDVPQRLVDNIKTKYAFFSDWTTDKEEMKRIIEKAFKNREKSEKDNSREQMKLNRCS